METVGYNERKIVQILAFLAWRLRLCSKLVLLKLIFLADRYHLRKYGRTITGSTYFAMRYGPVASEIKTFIESAGARSSYAQKFFSVRIKTAHDGKKREELESLSSPLMELLSESEREAMEAAISQLPLHSDLVSFTHRFPEWKVHEERLKRAARVKMNLVDFFKPCNASDEYCDAPQELVELNREFFEECPVP